MRHAWHLAAASTVVMALAQPAAQAQFVKQDYIAIASEDLSPQQFLTGQKGKPITLAGVLRLPKLGERLPVVVIMPPAPGVGGPQGATETWAKVINEAGIATFIVDSFTPREAYTLAEVQKVPQIPRTLDAYRALQVIAKHPSVDPSRIAVMGLSHGGNAATYSNLVRFQRQYGTPDLQYVGHISLYGNCMASYRDDEDSAKPLLMLHGVADDWLPIDKCREYAARLAKAGRNVRLIEYPDAHHAFDAPNIKPDTKVPLATTLRKCSLSEGDNGAILNAARQPFTPTDACVEKGTTIGYHEASAKKAYADVTAFLRDVFERK
jgi:dienelactone hydrolase